MFEAIILNLIHVYFSFNFNNAILDILIQSYWLSIRKMGKVIKQQFSNPMNNF